MSLISHFKAEPTEYVRKSSNGVTGKEGRGISFFYMPYNTSIELVSVAVCNNPFVFTELSVDNQEVTLQGELVYRIANPNQAMKKYNFAIDPDGREYITDDYTNLPQHVLQIVRADARKIVQATTLEKLIVACDDLSKSVSDSIKKSETLKEMGIMCEMLYFSSIKPKPEIAKALEAEYREALLQKADEAIYGRRALAVEKERAIKTNEMATEIGIEEQRKNLVALKGENAVKEAEARALAARAELAIFDGKDAQTITAIAFYQLGMNAGKIQSLTITPEILAALGLKR